MGKENGDGKKYTGYDDRFSTYVWNSETKEFFGRTGVAWAKLTIFYIIFYCGLAAFAGLCYYLFSRTLTDQRPKWILAESLIGTNPGLGYRPMPDPDNNADSTLIWYNMADKKDASFWYNQLEEYANRVDESISSSQGDVISCTYDSNTKATQQQSCRVDTSEFGQACSKANHFGYLTGEPCILLKLNKIYGWEPDCFGINKDGKHDLELLRKELDDQEKSGMPTSLKNFILRNVQDKPEDKRTRFLKTIWVSCEGEGKPDQESLGSVAYYPQQGIPGFYFPYEKQGGYQSPFIFAQIKNPLRGVLINVECKAWARNIYHDRVNRQGSVHFELLIDG